MERVLREGAFRGETHLVTGATQGIGKAVAAGLAAHGAQVMLVDLETSTPPGSARRATRTEPRAPRSRSSRPRT